MDSPTVDIFIPVIVGIPKFPASLYSALTQTYPNVRVILWLDHAHEGLEELLDRWWYRQEDTPRSKMTEIPFSRTHKNPTIEYCKNGVVVRNPIGPMGTAGVARQWILEWPDKSPVVKMLDADDILFPEAVEIMMRYLTPENDGVLCPMIRAAACRFAEIISGELEPGHMGSGCVMMKKESMLRMAAEGFVWPNEPGHDRAFIDHAIAYGYKFGSTGIFNVIYCYLKS